MLDTVKQVIITEYNKVAADLHAARALVDRLTPQYEALAKIVDAYGWNPNEGDKPKIIVKDAREQVAPRVADQEPEPKPEPPPIRRPAPPTRAIQARPTAEVAQAVIAERPMEEYKPPAPLRPSTPPPQPQQQSVARAIHERVTYPVVDMVPKFTGPTGITIDMPNGSLSFGSKSSNECSEREIRMVAALAKLQPGSFLPRDYVAKNIWKRLPQQPEQSVAALIPPLNIKLRRVRLNILSVMGVGLAIAPIDGA